MATQAQLAAVQQLYVGYLGRAADSAGQKFWADAIANGTATIKSVATGFTLSAEYKAAYAGLSTDALVEKVYNNVLGRAPDAAGKAFWIASLANGKVTADTLVATIVTNLGALDQATINNKVFVAQTYTDTAGTAYNPAAGAQVLVGVDSTAASVAAATAKIANGVLPGQVPAQGLIDALAKAQANVPAFETANKAAIDALVAKLAPVTTVSNATDALTAASTFAAKLTAAQTDANEIRVAASAEADTTVLVARAATAATELATARAGLVTTTDKANAAKYEAAVATEVTAKAAAATAVDKAAVVAGLGADTSATTVLGTYTDAATLYSTYVNATAAERAVIDTAFKDSKYFATFKATVAKDAAYADAIKASTAAKDLLDTDTAVNVAATVNGVTVALGVDGTVGSTEANTFAGKAAAKAAADALVTTAQAADANKAAVDALIKQYADANKGVTTASDAIVAFNGANTTVQAKAIAAVTADAAVKESFYFAAKPTGVIGDDVAITSFGAGDSIVLGSSVTYNAGALSTGNNNAAEFFLVKTDTGVQVVIENSVFGSAAVTASATTGVAAAADGVSVITLTGVTLDHVSVANGVVSYV